MTVPEHLRLIMEGEIAGGKERFSCSLSLLPHHNLWQSALVAASPSLALSEYLRDWIEPSWEDLHTDVSNFWGHVDTGTHALAVLKKVKLAPIGPDGKYQAAALEALKNTPGGASTDADALAPWQVSRKVTLETDGDLGRIKGGFYLPCPVTKPPAFDSATNLWDGAWVANVQAQVVAFLNNIANAPGLDTVDLRPVVVSSGRHNKNGTLRQGPSAPEVKRVSIGRRPDIQRRRANQVNETRGADSGVSF